MSRPNVGRRQLLALGAASLSMGQLSAWANPTPADTAAGTPAHVSTGAKASTPPPRKSSTRRPLRLAVVPQLTPVEMYARWTPLTDELKRRGQPCELVIYPAIAEFEAEFLSGKADVVYLNPYHMVMAQKARDYQAVLRSGRPLQGVLVVHKDSGLERVEQLKNQRVSFPAPNALAASLYIRAILERKYSLPIEAHFAKNHRNAIRQVMVGDSAAAGVVLPTLMLEPEEVRAELKVVYTTPAVASHPLAVHPRVPQERRDELVTQIRAIADDPALKHLVDNVMLTELTVARYAQDYAPLSQLGLERYVVRE